MKTICIYHSRDLDGWTSAAIVKKAIPDVELIGWDYGDSEPFVYDVDSDYLPKDDQLAIPDKGVKIIIVDICFAIETMKNLVVNNLNVVWIDHHKSAIEQAADNEVALMNGRRNTKYAACELTWQYFFLNEPMPEAIRLLGMYDSFRHKNTDEEQKVLMFQYAARALASNPQEAEQFLLDRDSHYINQIVEDGKKIYNYLCVETQQAYDNGFKVTFDGHPFIVIPKERINPVNFGIDYHNQGYSGAACFRYKDHKWSWSLYNDDGTIDVSKICSKRGGGGHKGAAGFVSDKLEVWDK